MNENDTAKPNRRRGQLIVAGAVWFVMLVAGWWHWPRGDARFIGKWKVISYGKVGSNEGWIVLYANGAADGELSGFRPAIWQIIRRSNGDEVLYLEDLFIRVPGNLSQPIWFSVHSLKYDSIALGIDPLAAPDITLVRVVN